MNTKQRKVKRDPIKSKDLLLGLESSSVFKENCEPLDEILDRLNKFTDEDLIKNHQIILQMLKSITTRSEIKLSFLIIYILQSLPETPSRGWGLIPDMIQVCDYDILIVVVELHTLIYLRPLNEWRILELGHFEVGNFGQKLAFFRL